MGASAANKAAIRDYKHQLAIREGNWNKEQSVFRNNTVDYQKEYSENNSAAGRAYAAEQARMNEMFDQVAFQKQDMLAQLVQGQGQLGASEKYGKTAARMNTAMLGQFGRNNAIIAANLASARTAAMQRNEDTRLQLMGANNKAWNQVATPPTPTVAPPPPQMQKPDYFGLATGLIGAVGGGLMKGSSNKAPSGWNDTVKYNPSTQVDPGLKGWGGTGGYSQYNWGPKNAVFTDLKINGNPLNLNNKGYWNQ
jgi:hypothetical protein